MGWGREVEELEKGVGDWGVGWRWGLGDGVTVRVDRRWDGEGAGR